MANDNQQPGFTFVSSKGWAKYPKLNVPDTKFKQEGEYNCKLFMPAGGKCKIKGDSGWEVITVEELEQRLEAEYKASITAAKNTFKKQNKRPADIKPMTKPWGWNDELDDDGNPIPRTENSPPREFYISAKMTASGVSKKTGQPFEMRPTLFSAGNPAKGVKPADITNKCAQIGNKSVLALSCQASHFMTGPNAGITIRLNSVQVLEIKNEGGRDADSQGFDSEEGYEGEEYETSSNSDSGGKPSGRRNVGMDESDEDEDESDGPSDD